MRSSVARPALANMGMAHVAMGSLQGYESAALCLLLAAVAVCWACGQLLLLSHWLVMCAVNKDCCWNLN